MDIPTASPDTFSPLVRVLTKAALRAVGIPHSNPSLGRMEKAGLFPKRFYLSARIPVWSASEVTEWLAARQAAGRESTVTQKATDASKRRRQAVAG